MFFYILIGQISCTNTESKSIRELQLDYPLVEFYINDSICQDNISLDSNKNVNDLKIDTSSSSLKVSFDCDNVFGEVGFGSIERRLVKKNVMTLCDTIFLNYSLINNSQITKPIKRRLHYGITDALSYKHCVFIPREIY